MCSMLVLVTSTSHPSRGLQYTQVRCSGLPCGKIDGNVLRCVFLRFRSTHVTYRTAYYQPGMGADKESGLEWG